MWTTLRRLGQDPFVGAIATAVLAFAVHLHVLSGDFVFDDIPAIVDNPLVDGRAPAHAIWEQSFWGERPGFEHVTTWRPLTTLGFRLTYSCSATPFAFRLVNLCLHAFVTALVAFLVGYWSRRALSGLLAGALFAVLPVHVEAIAGAVNRAELQAAAAYVIGLILVLRAQREADPRAWAAAVGAFAVALLSKEHAVTFPVAGALLYGEALLSHRREPTRHARPATPPVWALVGAGLVLVTFILVRREVLPAVFVGDIPLSDNPMVGLSRGDAFMTACKVYLHALRLLVTPVRLGADYGPNVIPMADGLTDPQALLGLVAILASFLLVVWAAGRHLGLATTLVLFALLYAPVSNLIVPSSALLGERLLYLPSVAIAAAFGRVAEFGVQRALLQKLGVIFTVALLALLTAYGARSVIHVLAWKDSVSLFRATILAYPDSVRAHQNLAAAYMERGRLDDAESEATAADGLAGGDPDALITLGEIAWRRGRAEQALDRAKESLVLRPSRTAMKLLCRAELDADRFADAATHCRVAASTSPTEAEWWHRLGLALGKLNRYGESRTALERAAAIEPDHAAIREALRSLAP